eukprot:750248-Hanusia_phi.AAC.1
MKGWGGGDMRLKAQLGSHRDGITLLVRTLHMKSNREPHLGSAEALVVYVSTRKPRWGTRPTGYRIYLFVIKAFLRGQRLGPTSFWQQ